MTRCVLFNMPLLLLAVFLLSILDCLTVTGCCCCCCEDCKGNSAAEKEAAPLRSAGPSPTPGGYGATNTSAGSEDSGAGSVAIIIKVHEDYDNSEQ